MRDAAIEPAEGDSALQLKLLGAASWQGNTMAAQKTEFRTIAAHIIKRAIAAGAVRADLTIRDFP